MNIKILSIRGSQDPRRVEFDSSIGIGIGEWKGKLPAQGESVDVEIEVVDDLEWGKNITLTNENASTIASENSLFRFVAEVLSYEDDGCLIVKLGESVVLLDANEVPSDIKGWVECKARTVRLYPTNL